MRAATKLFFALAVIVGFHGIESAERSTVRGRSRKDAILFEGRNAARRDKDQFSVTVPKGAAAAEAAPIEPILVKRFLNESAALMWGDFPETANDVCEAAVPMKVGESIQASGVRASTINMTTCGTHFLDMYPASGLFYSTVGTGDGLTVDFRADFDIYVSVFSGENCDELTCVTGSSMVFYDNVYDDSSEMGEPIRNGTLSWASEEGETYYIYAHQAYSNVSQIEVTLSGGGQIPSNYDCSGAIPVVLGQPVNGSTTFGQILPQVCDTLPAKSNPTTAPGIWYSFTGSGESVLFKVTADYDSQIALFSGENCNTLTCVTENDIPFVQDADSSLVQFLEEGQTYYIFVNGFDKNHGSFSLSAEIVETPENDLCSSASELEPGVLREGSTLAATARGAPPSCGTNISSPGVWYSLKGTGSPFKVTADTSLSWVGGSLVPSVYAFESCDDLICVQAGDPGTPTVFVSQENTQYLIYIFGVTGNDRNSFNVSVEEIQRPPNEACESATALYFTGPVQGDTTASLGEESIKSCDEFQTDDSTGSVWYTFTGTGGPLLLGINTNIEESQLIPDVSLYSGGTGCGSLVCLDAPLMDSISKYAVAIQINSNQTQTYFVRVAGFYTTRGKFEIDVTEFDPADNVNCATAIGFEVGDSVSSSTLFLEKSAEDEDFDCGSAQGRNFSSPGVWYTITGTGGTMEVTVNSTFYTHTALFSGESCGSLSCVDGSAAFASGLIVWDSVEGVTYYINLHGDSESDIGDFGLAIREVTRPPNDVCDGAVVLDDFELSVSTQYARKSDFGDCGRLDVTSSNGPARSLYSVLDPPPHVIHNREEDKPQPSLWYKIESEVMTIEEGNTFGYSVTIENFTDFHRLGVFVGDGCDNLVCVGNATGDFTNGGAGIIWDRGEDAATYYVLLQSYTDSGAESRFNISWGVWAVAK